MCVGIEFPWYGPWVMLAVLAVVVGTVTWIHLDR
jgi:hypothetical protein